MTKESALWPKTGLRDDNFEKPIIVMANSYMHIVPDHAHIKDLGDIVASETARAIV